jgi:acetolactate synthase-1/2/3 large subunit
VDWVAAGRAFGVPGSRVTTADAFADALRAALSEPGPSLVEAVLGP